MGRIERHRGVVVRVVKSGEASRAVDVLVEAGGVINCLARGAAKSKTRFVGALEPFTSGTFHLRHGKGRPTLEGVDDVRSRFEIARSVGAMAVASCACEWMLKTSRDAIDGPAQLRHLEILLDQAHEGTLDPAILLYSFETGLLRLAGVLPDITLCYECGKDFDASDVIGLCHGDGTFVHRGHGVEGAGMTMVEPDVRQVLTAIWTKDAAWCSRLKTTVRQRGLVGSVMGALLEHHFGFVVPSRSFALHVLAMRQ